MGRRKFKLGRIRKNEERRRQTRKINKVGRPPKKVGRPPKKINKVGRSPKKSCPPPHQEDTVQSLRSHCSESLPAQWIDQSEGTNATFCKIVRQSPELDPIVSHCVVVKQDMSWKVYIHGKEISPQSCSILKNIGERLDRTTLHRLLTLLDKSKVCVGNSDRNFVSMLQSKKGVIKAADGIQSAYLDESMPVHVDGEVHSNTVRSTKCEVITHGLKCSSCVGYRSTLRSLYGRWRKLNSPSRRRKQVRVDSHTNYRYLNTPEKKKRLSNLHNETKSLQRRVESLNLKIKKSTEDNGICLEQDMDADLRTIMNEHNDAVCASNPQESFNYIFWKQQRDSMLVKDARQMRWHPMMIKWCMNLRMLSSSCYNTLRSTGVLQLPSERTLRDYTHVVKAKSGLHSDVDKQLLKEANMAEILDHQKYVALIFDEVKIKEDLVYNKHSGELIGFINITNINHHLTALEQSCTGETTKPQLATHMLVFMIRGLFSSLEFPYAQFPVATAPGDVLFPIVWQCIEHLEMIGFKVLALVCDGATPNRKFFKMHSSTSENTHKVPNIYATDADRPLFLISDVPHLLKTTRNSWANSHAHSNSRKLWNNGQEISWQHLVRLYERHNSVKHSTPGLTILPKLKYEHIHLNSYSKMRVDLAAQVLSKSVADALSLEDDPTLCETEKFVRNFDRFFDCMNVRSLNEAQYKRKPDLRPYRSASDSRLTWLEDDFLTYLDKWEKSVDARRDVKKKDKAQLLLATETRKGLRFTVTSVVELVKYALTSIPGVKFVLTEHLCQDPLEAFFGRQRMSCGHNNNPSVKTFLQNTVSLRIQGSAAMQPYRGNCRRGKRKHSIPFDDTPLPKRRRQHK